MIDIEISAAVALYSGMLALLIAVIWVYTEFSVKRPQQQLGKQYLRRCTFCGLSYLDELEAPLSRCPRCRNLNRVGPEVSTDSRAGGVPDPARVPSRRNPSKGKRSGQRSKGGRRRR